MNDDLVVQKILKLLENNTAFIGYALNGGIGTKINVRNTETGKTIQALSINVDSTGEVLVVKDSEDGLFKAVTFKTAEKVSERIIQLRKTKPVDDKKTLEYTDSDIEVFYLFVKLIDTGSPVPTQLKSTWIRKGSSCTQFVGAYERCNYASKETIGGISYTGLPYKPYETLQACLDDDLGRDAKTPHGTKDENGVGLGWRIYSTKMTANAEQLLKGALESHDNFYGTNFKKLFGYGSILECSGAMYIQGWEFRFDVSTQTHFVNCEFSYLPGFTLDCSSAQQQAGYCDTRGFIGSKAPLFGQEAPGQPSLNQVDNSWGHQYGWKDLPYEFKYKRHFPPSYLNGQNAQGSFLIIEGLTDDQQPTIPEGYFLWKPGCPANGQGGPYDGSGGNRFPDGEPPIRKRDMKLSTHKAEIWLGSSKKTEAIKLYELGASELFSSMYNSFIVKADETQIDVENRLNRTGTTTEQDKFIHDTFYDNWNKNIIDQRIDPRMWVYIQDNVPKQQAFINSLTGIPYNSDLALFVHHLYQKTLNLTVVDNKTQVIHLKLGLLPVNVLSNTDCKGSFNGFGIALPTGDYIPTHVWQYQKNITITIKDWKIQSTTNILDTSELTNSWNKEYLSREYLTMFRRATNINSNPTYDYREKAGSLLLRPNNKIDITELFSGNHYEQFNYSLARLGKNQDDPYSEYLSNLWHDYEKVITEPLSSSYYTRWTGTSTKSWWEMWDKTHYDKKNKRLDTIIGYDTNLNEIYKDWGLSPSLTHEHGVFFEYFYYLPQEKNRAITSSLIKKIRLDPNNSYLLGYVHLKDRKTILTTTGNNFFFSDGFYRWTQTVPILSNGELFPTSEFSVTRTPLFNSRATYTSEDSPIVQSFHGTGTVYHSPDIRFRTSSWKNKLWAQIIYTGETKVDVDSYKNVEFKLPTNPSKYIKFTTNQSFKTSEFNFVDSVFQPKTELETVLSPGTLDITKQVKITKPTNVDLDPNYSFLVYLYPFVEVTKKKKTI